MQPKNPTDHIAILALMMVGVLVRRMKELDQLDESTSKHLHHLVKMVGEHARSSGIEDLKILFENIDRALG